MKNKIYLLMLSVITSLSVIAAENKGGLFVEPMLTYERGDGDVDLPTPFGSTNSEINGFGVGARLGFHVMKSIFIGADGRYSMPTYKNDDTDINSDATSYNFGPVVGFQVPTDIGIRVWAGYIMDGELDVDKDKGVDFKFKDASGYRVGAGLKLALVSLNLEYQNLTYDETEIKQAGIFNGTTDNVSQDNNSYILSVSFPISL